METLCMKKAIIIKSCKWTSTNIDKIYEFVEKKEFCLDNFMFGGDSYHIDTDNMYYSEIQESNDLKSDTLYIKTPEGLMKADINDYIMCGVKGEYYPCKEEIYIKTYFEVNATTEFDFSTAFNLAKMGYHLTRKGCEDRFFIYHQKAYPNGIECNEQTAKALKINPKELFCCEPYLQKQIKINEKITHVMYVPSMEDMYAEDWMVRFYEIE